MNYEVMPKKFIVWGLQGFLAHMGLAAEILDTSEWIDGWLVFNGSFSTGHIRIIHDGCEVVTIHVEASLFRYVL